MPKKKIKTEKSEVKQVVFIQQESDDQLLAGGANVFVLESDAPLTFDQWHEMIFAAEKDYRDLQKLDTKWLNGRARALVEKGVLGVIEAISGIVVRRDVFVIKRIGSVS